MRLIHSHAPIIIIAIFLLSFLEVSAKETIELNWALLQDTEKGPQAIDITTVPLLPRDSTLQLYIHPGDNTYTYVFLVDSSNQVIPIFPSSLGYYDRHSVGEEVRIPAGQDRFTIVPPPGEEKFFLLASADRLNDLEHYLEECLIRPDDINAQAKLYNEIQALRKTHSTLSQVTEKGMPVSGTARQLIGKRSAVQKADFQITHVTAESFYSRILRLNHD